jgi:hypothetical protein
MCFIWVHASVDYDLNLLRDWHANVRDFYVM